MMPGDMYIVDHVIGWKSMQREATGMCYGAGASRRLNGVITVLAVLKELLHTYALVIANDNTTWWCWTSDIKWSSNAMIVEHVRLK